MKKHLILKELKLILEAEEFGYENCLKYKNDIYKLYKKSVVALKAAIKIVEKYEKE